MHSRQVKKDTVCFLGGNSIRKASQNFGIPKMMLCDKLNNRFPNKKSVRMAELAEEEEKSLKLYIYILTALTQKQDLVIIGITTSRKGITSLIETPTILIVADPGC